MKPKSFIYDTKPLIGYVEKIQAEYDNCITVFDDSIVTFDSLLSSFGGGDVFKQNR